MTAAGAVLDTAGRHATSFSGAGGFSGTYPQETNHCARASSARSADVANAPFGIPCPQAFVENGIAGSYGDAVLLVGTVNKRRGCLPVPTRARHQLVRRSRG
jgi:hypothetical protein